MSMHPLARRTIVAAALVTTGGLTAAQSGLAGANIEQVAAFTRLYGVVRLFYPGDAAAGLDWDRFAVHGIARVRATPRERLETALEELFAPLGPGIEIGAVLPPAVPVGGIDPSLVAWRRVGPYSQIRSNRATAPTSSEFIALAQTIPPADHLGKGIRLRARMRVRNPEAPGASGLWLRVDRPNQQRGFFDNMQDRPVRETVWREYVIEGTVADDAVNIVFGMIVSGGVITDYDAIELAVRPAGGEWIPLPVANAGFESSAAADNPAPWVRGGTMKAAVTIEWGDAPEGPRFMRIDPSPAMIPATPGDARTGAHADVDLGAGLRARVRLSLTDGEARAASPALDALRAAVATVPIPPHGRSDIDVRLADVVVAWNVLRHFYPYWAEARVDWDARLRPQLEAAARAQTRAQHFVALRQLVADLRDGHGAVTDMASAIRRALLPIQIALVEQQLVVTASAAADVPVGSLVTAIDGRPAMERFEEDTRLASGTLQWRQARAARDMTSCTLDSTVRITITSSNRAPRDLMLPCRTTQPVLESRPAAIAELAPGIAYVDITRTTTAQFHAGLPALAKAKGIVFDLRGYPTDVGTVFLSHLIDAPEHDRWMHVARIAGPFGEVAGWNQLGWDLMPVAPRLTARRVALTDGRAISYAESVMGYIKDRKLATIVGGTTAGANGNVVPFAVPGGFGITFTGMRVTRHDGKEPHHLVGVRPDVPLAPTLAGVRAGRDELLERAIEILK